MNKTSRFFNTCLACAAGCSTGAQAGTYAAPWPLLPRRWGMLSASMESGAFDACEWVAWGWAPGLAGSMQ